MVVRSQYKNTQVYTGKVRKKGITGRYIDCSGLVRVVCYLAIHCSGFATARGFGVRLLAGKRFRGIPKFGDATRRNSEVLGMEGEEFRDFGVQF